MNVSARLSSAGIHRNDKSKEEYLALKSTENTEPFARYTQDPIARTTNPRPRSAAKLEGPEDHPKDGVPHDAHACPSTPFIYCTVTDADSENVVDEMVFQKLKEQWYSSQNEHPGSHDRVPKILNTVKKDTEKLENECGMNDHLVIPTCLESTEIGFMKCDIVEPADRYVRDPLTRNAASQKQTVLKRSEWQKDTFEDAKEDAFLALNPSCQEDKAVPECGKASYKHLNTLHPLTLVQDSLCSFHSTDSLEQSPSRNSSPSTLSGSRLSYFSYLGEGFYQSQSSASSSCTSSVQGAPRMMAPSSYAVFSPSLSSNAPSPSSPRPLLTAELDASSDKLDRVIDFCSCMCCVRAMFYHCTKDDDCNSTYSEPCHCEQPSNQCLKQWGFLGMLTCCMPCLLFYPPLKGIQKAAKRIKRFFRRKSVS